MNDRIVGLTKGKKITSKKDLAIPVVYIPQEVIDQTKDMLLSYSIHGQMLEGIVYWAGTETEQGLFVTHALTPRAITTPVSFRVSALENARVISSLQEMGLQLIAQVHSHPNGADVNHIITEPEMGFMPFEDFFSIVVKDYAVDGLLPLTEKIGAYIFQEGNFIRLSDKQIQAYLRIVPSHAIL